MSRQEAALELRRRILQVVAQFPGIHVRLLARMLDRSQAITDYHVTSLLEARLLRAERMDAYLRLYPPASQQPLDATERVTLGMLRERQVLHIALFLLLQARRCRHAEIARGTGLGKSLLSFHLDKMVANGLVRSRDEQYFLADPDLVRRLLASHQPVPDLREEFSDLWDALYD